MNSTARLLRSDLGFNGSPTPPLAPLAELLASGGDTRLACDTATGLNRYGCSILPRLSALSFSSSTASSLSRRALARVEAALASWNREARSRGAWTALDRRVEGLREEFCDLFGLCVSDVDIVFSPSGIDAQLLALAAVRARLGAPMITIVVAADETGSGSVFTAEGRHFNHQTAHGRAVALGARLDGLHGVDDAIQIPANGPAGPCAIAEIDEAVLDAVASARRAGRTVLLQAMDCSKFGGRYPSEACLDLVRQRWPDGVQIVRDACQMRVSRLRLQAYLDQGDMVLVTGSKFFTGPAFSGALLMPTQLSGKSEPHESSALGLRDYASRQDWPSRQGAIRAALPCRVALGPWLRWEAAMAEMEDYFAVPSAFRRDALRLFGEAATPLANSGSRRTVVRAEDPSRDEHDEEFATPTIFPFTLANEDTPITRRRASALHVDLNRDMTSGLRPSAGPATRDLAARLCHIGQPVPLVVDGHETAALRVSADARFVVECWSPDPARSRRRIRERLAGLRATFDKLDFLQAGDDSLASHPRSDLKKVH